MNKLAAVSNKIKELDVLLKTINIWRLKNDTIVFTNGCFDLLHEGHISYMADAASLGNKLVVAINTDESVKKLGKSKNRPIQNQKSRAMIIASLQVVDAVILFDDETPEALVKLIRPDVLVKGGDWQIEKIVGHDFVKSYNGTVCTIPLLEGFSTTSIEQKIIDFSKA